MYLQFGSLLTKRGPGVCNPGKFGRFQMSPGALLLSYRNPLKCNSDTLENDHLNGANLPFSQLNSTDGQ